MTGTGVKGWSPIEVPGDWSMQGQTVKPWTAAGDLKTVEIPADWKGIDPYSLLLAREANVAVYDAAFARELHADLERAIEKRSRRVLADAHAGRGLLRRMRDWVAYGLLRFATVVVAEGATTEVSPRLNETAAPGRRCGSTMAVGTRMATNVGEGSRQ